MMKKKSIILFSIFLIVSCTNWRYYRYVIGFDRVANKAKKSIKPLKGDVAIYITCCFDSVYMQLYDGDTLLWDDILHTDRMAAMTKVVFYNKKSQESTYRFIMNKNDTTFFIINHPTNKVSWIELDRNQLTKKVNIKSVENRPR